MRAATCFALLTTCLLAQPRDETPAPSDPGRVTARRLNRYEYNNTIRDLLAVDFQPAADFPADDSGYGFDNIGDVLSLSPVLMEKYLAAAEKIAQFAAEPVPLPKPTIQRHGRGENRAAGRAAELIVSHRFPAEGDYNFVINVSGRPDPLRVRFSIDGAPLPIAKLQPDVEDHGVAEMQLHVRSGEYTLRAELIPDGPPAPDPDFEDGQSPRPLAEPAVAYIEVRGPYHPLQPSRSESYARVFPCGHAPGHHSLECVRTSLATLARRAYRRPVTGQEVDSLVRLVQSARQQGDAFDRGMQVAITALLVSPHFLFRIERDPNPSDPLATHQITDFELATRLSYFLWSSMPDDELFRAASDHSLRQSKILRAQIQRMLADRKAKALVENFAGQWLQLRNLDTLKPDPDRFPAFDGRLRRDLQRESQLFFESILRDDRSILEFLDVDYTFLNERLADFYGIPAVRGAEFRRVTLPPGSHRGGILTQAAILAVSSYPTRTSPVIRGKWILENILDTPPPPPPPNVPNLDEKAIGKTASLRTQLEQHRANPVCRGCHARMDVLGFGLENYDAIGRWRTHDGGFPIDASGKLPNGQSFSGPEALKQLLVSDKDAFARCLTDKLLTYALGRGLEDYDQPAVESIVRATAAEGYKFRALVEQIVSSRPFQMRRGEAGHP
ncbi:MAG TPA: DUF1592 domain-containing protein [Bryobacteraceae bacterium]|nr:DUF1592 domain-containing protein [Bryobacteraceae bacterium]